MPENTLAVNKVMPGGIDTVFSIPIPSPEAVHVAADGPVVTVSIHHDGAPPVPVVEGEPEPWPSRDELVQMLEGGIELLTDAEARKNLMAATAETEADERRKLAARLDVALGLLSGRAMKRYEAQVAEMEQAPEAGTQLA